MQNNSPLEMFTSFEQELNAVLEENERLRGELEQLTQTSGALEKQNKELLAKVDKLEKENKDLKAQQTELDKMQEKLASYQSRVRSALKQRGFIQQAPVDTMPANADISEELEEERTAPPKAANITPPDYRARAAAIENRKAEEQKNDDIEEGVLEFDDEEEEEEENTAFTGQQTVKTVPSAKTEQIRTEETVSNIRQQPAPQSETRKENAAAPVSNTAPAAASNATVPAAPTKETAEPENEYGYFPYKDDIYSMSKHEFTFTYSKLYFADEMEELIDMTELIVTPLNTKEKYPPLLIWMAFSNNETFTTTTPGGESKHIIPCGKYSILLSGTIKKGVFVTRIVLKQDESTNGIQLKVSTTQNGLNGHLYIAHENSKIHIAPVNFANNEAGYADFMYCIVENGVVTRCGDNINEKIYITDSYKTKKEIIAKWAEGTLYGVIVPAQG